MRQFKDRLADGSYALMPVLDVINHDGSVPTGARVENESLFVDVAADSKRRQQRCSSSSRKKEQSLLSGLFPQQQSQFTDELCTSYGDLTNLDTLRNYSTVLCNPTIPARWKRLP